MAQARKRLPIDANAKCNGTRSGVSIIRVSSVARVADIPFGLDGRTKKVSKLGRFTTYSLTSASLTYLLEHSLCRFNQQQQTNIDFELKVAD
jgi:hypothetical protein